MSTREVKTQAEEASAGSIAAPKAKSRWSRHLDGWQIGVVVVGLALVGVVFGVVRPAPPDRLPLPYVDLRELARHAREDDARMRQVEATPLSFEVRAIGEAVRRYGSAVARKDVDGAVGTLREARGMTRELRAKHGDEGLLLLRAVQTRLFLDALHRFEQSGNEDDELVELGERFVDKARAAAWLRPDGTLLQTVDERRVMFRIRWAELLGLRQEARFMPTANELRAYYAFLLAHPEKDTPAEARIALVTATERVDLQYPGLFARGVLFYRAGRYDLAEQAFRGHLAKHPGLLRLRARNHLAAVMEERTP
ncbi:MAG: hypothetical protein R3B13_21570 [Polyangiaceae bacterium]